MQSGSFSDPFILLSISQHALGKRQRTSLHRSLVYHSVNTQRCTLCEKKSERGSLLTLCVFSRVGSHKPRHKCPAWYLDPPAVLRPRDSLSQPLPFTVCCLLSVSLPHAQKDSISPPPVTLPLSHALLKLLLAGVSSCPMASPLRTPWHKDGDDDRRSIRRKEYRRRRRGQQLWT